MTVAGGAPVPPRPRAGQVGGAGAQSPASLTAIEVGRYHLMRGLAPNVHAAAGARP